MIESFEEENELPSSFVEKNKRKTNQSYLADAVEHIFPKNEKQPINLDATDTSLILFFLGIGILTRVIRIYYPKNVAFNEDLYGNYMNNYLCGIFFTDNNPPLPKLIMTSIAYFSGYRGEYSFEKGSEYSSMHYIMLRLIPAFFSSLCVPLSYITMRIIGVCHFGSSCAAFLICSDLVLIVQGRFFVPDGFIHFFSILSILSIFLYERLETLSSLIFEGVCLGMLFSSKITTGGIILLSLLRQFPLNEIKNRSFVRKSGPSIVRCFILISLIISLHYIFYCIHFTLLPFKEKGQSLAFPKTISDSLVEIDPRTVDKIRKTTIWSSGSFDSIDSLNSVNWQKLRKNSPSMFLRVISLFFHNVKMNNRASSDLGKPSSSSSPWWSLAVCLAKYVPIWDGEQNRKIGAICNVCSWIPVFVGIILSVFISGFNGDLASPRAGLMIGYLLSYLPFAFVSRQLSYFHCTIPLILGVFNLVLVVDFFCGKKARGFVYLMLIHFSVAGYFFWSPLSYGKHVGDLDFRFIIKKWIQ